jgi:hypothetical protein
MADPLADIPAHVRAQLKVHFQSRVSTQNPNSCWIWVGSFSKQEPRLSFSGRSFAARHVSLLLAGEFVVMGARVRSRCGSPSCCNPDHLYQRSIKLPLARRPLASTTPELIRRVTLQVRLRPSERKQIKEAASAARKTLCQWAREQLLLAATQEAV